jgi:hypothetical protein
MDGSARTQHDTPSRPDIIKNLADHLQRYPQDIVDAKRLIKNFRVSAHEFYQALLVIDHEPSLQRMFS